MINDADQILNVFIVDVFLFGSNRTDVVIISSICVKSRTILSGP